MTLTHRVPVTGHTFDVVEASIEDLKHGLSSGKVTCIDLVTLYLQRIAAYDLQGPSLNSFTLINPKVLEEAKASDDRRSAGLPDRPLEGIPYTLKDTFKYFGMTVSAGSPAFKDLMSSEDAFVAAKLRAAGAVLLGKTNTPPMAGGGMQRGLYGRAESPYNLEYLTAAFMSGSSNGAATSTAASFAGFALGSETVSSGRSPASNNGLVAYTPSRGLISCRGLWPLYGTCDVVVPYTRSIKDLLVILPVLLANDQITAGDFWRDQPFVTLPSPQPFDYSLVSKTSSLHGTRIGVPKMYVGIEDPKAKSTVVNPSVIELWDKAKADLEALGAEVVLTDFPLVTNYEDDSVSQQANNVRGVPANWNTVERGLLIAKGWDDFLKLNGDPNCPGLAAVDASSIFPKPQNYIPDLFAEVKNAIPYADIVNMAKDNQNLSIYDISGLSTALYSLEAQRKRDFEDWLDANKLDFVVFPANGDVGRSDVETNVESARHALQNGVKYSNGNRAIRHLGVPTVNVTMGIMVDTKMPVNLTFAGKAYTDDKLLQYAYAYEQKSCKRIVPPLTPRLNVDSESYSTSLRSALQSRFGIVI